MPALRKAFNKGLAPGEFLQVKAGFATPDGEKEWMWVEVTAWNDDKIRGLLRNEPYKILKLHGGQVVKIAESDVFDYLYRHADGVEEGNDTGRIIEKNTKSTK